MVKDYWHEWNDTSADVPPASAAAAKIPIAQDTAAPAPVAPALAGSEDAQETATRAAKLRLERAYDLGVLNTDSNYPVERIVSGLSNFAHQLQAKTNKVRNCCLLFYGAPGTGKTEFGKYLASQIDFDFLVRRGSDLLGEFVGQTEHAIKNLFDEAEARHAIVMIDEADTFLRNRSLSQREYELSMTNELLCRMEEFSGIFICSTNLLKIFDPASLRRFLFKIHFKPLTEAGKERICRKMMGEVCDLPEDLSALAQLENLTPGNFRTVRDRLLILNENRVSFDELLRELQLELTLGNATIPLSPEEEMAKRNACERNSERKHRVPVKRQRVQKSAQQNGGDKAE